MKKSVENNVSFSNFRNIFPVPVIIAVFTYKVIFCSGGTPRTAGREVIKEMGGHYIRWETTV